MKNIATGNNDAQLSLTPPIPTNFLLGLIDSELQPTEDEKRRINALVAARLPPLIRTEVLSMVLGVSHKLLFAMAHTPEKYYRRFEIPKRGGGTRRIATPRVFLKVVQKWILLNILYKHQLPPYVTGFVPGRGIIANASSHTGKRYLAKIDIENFFPSIGFQRVKGVYEQCGFPAKVTNLLAGLSILGGKLPQGAPSSPYIANLVFEPIDRELNELAETANLTYSRYADDLTFSSNNPIPKDLIAQIERLVTANSFRINKGKSRLLGPGQRRMTTGLVVNVKAQPVRWLRRRLRARFHQAALRPNRFKEEASQLLGWAAYVNMYDPSKGKRYLAVANRVVAISQ